MVKFLIGINIVRHLNKIFALAGQAVLQVCQISRSCVIAVMSY